MIKTRAQLQLEALRTVREATKPAVRPVEPIKQNEGEAKPKRKGKGKK